MKSAVLEHRRVESEIKSGRNRRSAPAQGVEGAARLHAVLECLPTNILMTNLEFEITYVNPASLRTLKSVEKHLPLPAD